MKNFNDFFYGVLISSFLLLVSQEIVQAQPNNPHPCLAPDGEIINLNRRENTILQKDYNKSTGLMLQPTSGEILSLSVGSMVEADQINMVLRNVSGKVYCRVQPFTMK